MPSFSNCLLGALTVPSLLRIQEDNLAFWRLEDTTDSSINGNTLTNNGSLTFVAGKIENCGQFAPAVGAQPDKFLSLASFSSPFNSGQPYSISIWHNSADIKNYFTLISCSTAQSLHIHGDSNGTLFINNSQTADVSVAGFFVANEWHHLVVARTSSGYIKVYKDSTLVYNALAGVTYGSVPNLRLGSLQDNGNFTLNGKLDAVGLWTRELDQTEVNQLYNGGVGLQI